MLGVTAWFDNSKLRLESVLEFVVINWWVLACFGNEYSLVWSSPVQTSTAITPLVCDSAGAREDRYWMSKFVELLWLKAFDGSTEPLQSSKQPIPSLGISPGRKTQVQVLRCLLISKTSKIKKIE
jgi:hypothetical protein